ncbi:MAG: nodulation protein NfeD [Anaerolineaceae bacterium]
MLQKHPIYDKFLPGFLIFYLLVAFLNIGTAPVQANSDSPVIVRLAFDGPLTPVMVNYIERGMDIAENNQAEMILLTLNTPGGSIDLMNKIIQEIRGSSIPIVVYIAPRGAMAGSAGTLITLAGHVAAMAPETAIGAASPVGSQGEDIGETLETKQKEILKATARSLAEKRGTEAISLAESTIENAKAVSSTEALRAGLIDIIASDQSDLLEQLNGRTIVMNAETIQLDTSNADFLDVNQSFIEQVLQMLTDTNIVFLLLTVGIQAVLIELSSPGGWVAGFVGVVCVILSTYGLGILPVNWFGILFIIIAFVLFILELKTHTFGALTAAGIGSFIAGSLILFNSVQAPGFQKVSVPLVIGTGVFIALSFSVIVSFILKAIKKPVLMGKETLLGKMGFTVTALNPTGTVQVAGEQWSAILSDQQKRLPEGVRIEVVRVDGLTLEVKEPDK